MAEAEDQGHRNQGRPVPVVLAVVVCDMAMRDALTNKVSLIGLFSMIRASTFPCVHPSMTIYAALTGGHGSQEMEIRLVRAEDDQPVVGVVGRLDFVDPLQVYELIVEWRGVKFEKRGDYLIEVCSPKGSDALARRKFSVIGLDQVQPTDGSEGGSL